MSAYEIREEDGLVMVTLTGRLRYHTIFALLEELDAKAVWSLPEPLKVLIDETGAQPSLLGAGDIRNWISRWRNATALKQGQIAVIAPSLTMYGLNRMAQGVAGEDSEGHLEVFRDRGDAMAWLHGR